MFYSVVLLDGKELHNLSLEHVKELFFKRQINQNSLIRSDENPSWQMIKRVFDVLQWMPAGVPQVPPPTNVQNNFQPVNSPFEQQNQPPQNNFQPPQNQFHQPNPQNQAVTFNQFPQNQTSPPNNNFTQSSSNGYSQNNQSETYYQAETNQTNYNFQNNQPNFAPSKYNAPQNSYKTSQNNYNYSNNSFNNSAVRNGTKQAAVFLLINAFFYVVFTIVASAFSTSGEGDEAYKLGQGVGRSFIPLIIDLILAIKLWKLDNIESARKWVLVRSYFGFIIFGIIIPLVSFKAGGTSGVVIGVFSFVSSFFYFISLALVLHGKENPTQSRVMIGMGTFAIYFLVMFGSTALTVIGNVAPDMAKFDLPNNSKLDKYKVEGKEFQDKTTGAKVALPEGWSMLALDNPVIHTPEARMIAIDKPGNRLTMLEVVPVPGNLDIKRQNPAWILDQLADGVVKALKADADKKSNSFNEITRLNIYVGKHPAKLLVFDRTIDGLKAKGHLIITFDELTFYVLHSWCPAAEYEQAQVDFKFFEQNFMVPEKINSPFSQSAEIEKNKTNPKKNF